MVKDGLLAIIPWMSPEWIVSLTLRLINQLPGDSVCNIIHFTNGGNFGQLGNRIPAVFLTRDSDIPLIFYVNEVNGNNHWFGSKKFPISINVETHIELHQQYISNGNYRYFVKVNGEEILSILNAEAHQYYNVNVYASDPWHVQCQGYIKNLKLTNFL